jgi:hypothetical protein
MPLVDQAPHALAVVVSAGSHWRIADFLFEHGHAGRQQHVQVRPRGEADRRIRRNGGLAAQFHQRLVGPYIERTGGIVLEGTPDAQHGFRRAEDGRRPAVAGGQKLAEVGTLFGAERSGHQIDPAPARTGQSAVGKVAEDFGARGGGRSRFCGFQMRGEEHVGHGILFHQRPEPRRVPFVENPDFGMPQRGRGFAAGIRAQPVS